MNAEIAPNGWSLVNIGDEAYFSIVPSGVEKFSGTREYLSTDCIENDKIVRTEGDITFNRRPSRANMQPQLNSVWFARMKNTLKVYCFTDDNRGDVGKYLLSTGFCGIICGKTADPNF